MINQQALISAVIEANLKLIVPLRSEEESNSVAFGDNDVTDFSPVAKAVQFNIDAVVQFMILLHDLIVCLRRHLLLFLCFNFCKLLLS